MDHFKAKACARQIDIEAVRETDTLIRDFDLEPPTNLVGGYVDYTGTIGVRMLDRVGYEFID